VGVGGGCQTAALQCDVYYGSGVFDGVFEVQGGALEVQCEETVRPFWIESNMATLYSHP